MAGTGSTGLVARSFPRTCTGVGNPSRGRGDSVEAQRPAPLVRLIPSGDLAQRAETALEVGHRGSIQNLFDHYVDVVSKEEAERFWALRLDAEENWALRLVS